MTIQNRIYRSQIQGIEEVSQFHQLPREMPYQPSGPVHYYPQRPPVDDPGLFPDDPYDSFPPGVETDQFSPMQFPDPKNRRETVPYKSNGEPNAGDPSKVRFPFIPRPYGPKDRRIKPNRYRPDDSGNPTLINPDQWYYDKGKGQWIPPLVTPKGPWGNPQPQDPVGINPNAR